MAAPGPIALSAILPALDQLFELFVRHLFKLGVGQLALDRLELQGPGRGWKFVEPSHFQSSWHIECICERLEAVANQQIILASLGDCRARQFPEILDAPDCVFPKQLLQARHLPRRKLSIEFLAAMGPHN